MVPWRNSGWLESLSLLHVYWKLACYSKNNPNAFSSMKQSSLKIPLSSSVFTSIFKNTFMTWVGFPRNRPENEVLCASDSWRKYSQEKLVREWGSRTGKGRDPSKGRLSAKAPASSWSCSVPLECKLGEFILNQGKGPRTSPHLPVIG